MTHDDNGMDRVLAAVGKQSPSDVDRNSLQADIKEAFEFYRNYKTQSGKGVRNKRKKFARDISQCAGGLLQLLEKPEHSEWVDQNLGSAFPPCEGMPVSKTLWDTGSDGRPVNIRRVSDPLRRYEQPSFGGLKAGLLKLRDRAEEATQLQTKPSVLRDNIKVTPLKWLLGHHLAEVYAVHFRREAGRGRRRKVREPYGPYIRFAVAVMEELGERVSAHTVDTAIKEVRANAR